MKLPTMPDCEDEPAGGLVSTGALVVVTGASTPDDAVVVVTYTGAYGADIVVAGRGSCPPGTAVGMGADVGVPGHGVAEAGPAPLIPTALAATPMATTRATRTLARVLTGPRRAFIGCSWPVAVEAGA
jgi:hypothetical protein